MIKLPIDSYINEVKKIVASNSQLILAAEPGAGKTTRIPPALITLTDKKIVILEPRRIAARSSCERIAEEQNWTVGQEVGYQVKLENKTSINTKIIFITEALLWKKLQIDPTLSDIGIIIFDEFHERNIYSDISLSIATELQTLERPDLKLILMSATLNLNQMQNFWPQSPVLKVPGLTYPCQIYYDNKNQSLRTDYQFIDKMVQKIKNVSSDKIQKQSTKHILVFLPGTSEIKRIKEKLESDLFFKRILIFELHGQIQLDVQKKVLIDPVYDDYLFKIILATNIAESSLTVDNVDTVIDSGLFRDWVMDNKKIYPLLKTQRISKASAVQRQGRAARQFNGTCIKMWTEAEEKTFVDFSTPDILKIDLSETLLFLFEMGITNLNSFSWFEPPTDRQIKTAINQLQSREIIDAENRLTESGKSIGNFKLSLDLSILLFFFLKNDEPIWGSQLVTILSEKDPWNGKDLSSLSSLKFDSDVAVRIHEFNDIKNKSYLSSLHYNSEKLCRLFEKKYDFKPLNTQEDAERLHKIIFDAFHFNLFRRRKQNSNIAQHIDGMGVELVSESQVQQSEFLIGLKGRSIEGSNQSLLDLASPVKKEWVLQTFQKEIVIKSKLNYDEEKNQFFKIEQKFLKSMALEDEIKKPCQPGDISLQEAVKIIWPIYKTKNTIIQQLQQRIHWASKIFPDFKWPKWNSQFDELLIDLMILGEKNLNFLDSETKNWEELVGMALDQIQTESQLQTECESESKSDYKSKRDSDSLSPIEHQNEKGKNNYANKSLSFVLKTEFPSHITTPNQKRIRLDYDIDTVNLSLKIQDAFGWKTTPQIAEGKINIRLLLLGPHHRPLQMTTDLASFWNTTYKQMRPSLKADYPKHKWPEDPT